MNSDKALAPSGIAVFAKLAIGLIVIADSVLLALGEFASESTITLYEDLVPLALLGLGVVLLVLIIPKVSDPVFKRTTIVLALGFSFQLAFSIVWNYNFHIANRDAMPNVGIGDFFYLGSYALWIYATLPYLRRYGTLMGTKSRLFLLGYTTVAAMIVYVVADYWYGAAIDYGYTTIDTVVWLSYAVVPTIVLFFVIAVALLYGFEGYGKGLLSYYWFFFLIPILLIASGDIVNGFVFALSESSAPAMLDDLLYTAGYAATLAASVAVLGSRLESVSAEPSIEQHVMKGNSVKITRGRGHIVDDPKSTLSFELFTSLMAEDGPGKKRGLVMTRRSPATINGELHLDGARVTWITTQPGENNVDPTKPNLIAHSVMEFLSSAPGGVVLLDGIESVLIYGDFSRALKMLEQINDFVMQYQGYLIVPIDPKVFGERERAMMERNFDAIDVRRPA
jgi:hypothetical protein